MKKLFIAVLALACLASCEKSQVIGEVEKDAITFGNSFVDNSTKAVDPSLTENTLNKFLVYGKLTNSSNESANLFNGIEVFKLQSNSTEFVQGTDNWGYAVSATRYWIPGNNYRFAAVACSDINEEYTGTSGGDNTQTGITSVTTDNDPNSSMPTSISFASTDGTEDLLYSEVHYTNLTAEQAKTEEVEFTFNHLLSKVKFVFENNYPENSDLFIEVEDIKITNPFTSGTYTTTTANSGSWGSQTIGQEAAGFSFGDVPYENKAQQGEAATPNEGKKDAADNTKFANLADIYPNDRYESNNERLLIPGTYKDLNIKFKASVWLKIETQPAIKVSEIDKSENGITAKDNITLNPGYCYNFVISLGNELDPIKFSVTTVKDWDDPDDETTEDVDEQEIPIVEATTQN